jgi:aspartyl-tRNA synthetase
LLKRTCYSNEVRELDEGKKVVLSGWVDSIRNLGKMKFIVLRDISGIIQITLKKETTSTETMEVSNSLKQEDVISVIGTVVSADMAPGGKEIIPNRIEVINRVKDVLPISMQSRVVSNLDTRLDWRVLDLKKPRNSAIFKIQGKIVECFKEYLVKKGFLQVFTPCLIGAASEGGAEVFPVLFFNKSAFLRQDPQLHRQLLILSGFDRIFDLGPSWRAEPSHTPRHLCEHRGCAVELGFIQNEEETMRLEEELIIHTLKKVKMECREEMNHFNKEVTIPKAPFPVLKFPQIYDILEELGKKIRYGESYDREAEVLLSKYIKEKYRNDFFFVTKFPFKEKPFYVMRIDEEPEWARSVDLIYKGLEQSSGGQREHRYEKIMNQIYEKKMNENDLEWFTKFFKYGAPPHGGFNLGIERFTMKLLDLQNIREAVLFPRAPERLLP